MLLEMSWALFPFLGLDLVFKLLGDTWLLGGADNERFHGLVVLQNHPG